MHNINSAELDRQDNPHSHSNFQKDFSLNNNTQSSKTENPCQMDTSYSKADPSMKSNSSSTAFSTMENLFKVLFGTKLTEWPYSEQTLQKALELRISQEKTKQEYYKVEKLNRSIELMKLAAISKVPGHLIPKLFNDLSENQSQSQFNNDNPVSSSLNNNNNNNNNNNANVNQNNAFSTPPQSNSPYSPSNSPSPVRANHHRRNRTISNISELSNSGNPNSFTFPPNSNLNSNSNNQDTQQEQLSLMTNFKFGGNSDTVSKLQRKKTLLPPKHQLSPSRIGAHAVSSLSRNTRNRKSINLSNFRHGLSHQRTLSLPSTVSIPEYEQMEFHNNGSYIKQNQNNFNESYRTMDIDLDKISSLEDQYRNQLINNKSNSSPSSNEETEDVEKLLGVNSSSINTYHRKKNKTLINNELRKHLGSPLKEVVSITSDDGVTTDDDSVMNLSSTANTSSFVSPIHQKLVIDYEPKTP